MDLHSLKQDQVLTNVSVQYKNAAMVAERVFLRVPVGAAAGHYYEFTKNNMRAMNDAKRPGTIAHTSDLQTVKRDYECDGHGLRYPIPDPWRKQPTGGVDLDIDTTTTLTEQLMLTQEINLYNKISGAMTPVNITAAKWDDDTIDPIKRVDAEKVSIAKKIGKIPNVLLLPRPCFTGVRNNALVKGRITGATELKNSSVTAQQLADAMELEEVLVADAVVNSAAEGQADSLDFVWGKTALLFYRDPSPGLRTVSLGYHLTWITGVNGQLVRVYRDEPKESDVIEVQKYYDQKIVSLDAGTFFTNVVA